MRVRESMELVCIAFCQPEYKQQQSRTAVGTSRSGFRVDGNVTCGNVTCVHTWSCYHSSSVVGVAQVEPQSSSEPSNLAAFKVIYGVT